MGNGDARDFAEPLSNPAFTTRPRRLLMIGRMQPGHEGDVIEAHERLPVDVAAGAGFEVIEAFVGSGYYALLLEIEGDDPQGALAAYLNDPRVQEFHASLGPVVSGFPIPHWHYVASDPLHGDPGAMPPGDAAWGPDYSSADLPLAASMYRWRREG